MGLRRGNHSDRSVRNATEVVSSLASRVEPVRDDQGVPRAVLRHEWAAFSVRRI